MRTKNEYVHFSKKKKIEREEKRPEFLFKIYMHTASPYTWLNVDFLNSQTEKCNVNLFIGSKRKGRNSGALDIKNTSTSKIEENKQVFVNEEITAMGISS